MKHLLILSALIFTAGCDTPEKPTTPPAQSQPAPFQRFLPLNAEGQKAGIPWSGFFALDSQTGQLCRTTPRQFGNEFDQIPSCSALAQGAKTEGKTLSFKEWDEERKKH
jgi:hypothetical protein